MEPKYYAVKNWGKFQEKSRNDHAQTGRHLTWIKFYPALLDDLDFSLMSEGARLFWPSLLLLAAKNGGLIPNHPTWIRRMLHIKGKIYLEIYINHGFLIPVVGENGNSIPQIRIEENREDKKREDISTDAAEASSLPEVNASHGSTRSVLAFSYESGSLTGVNENDISEWERAYPAVDVRRNIAAAAVWLGANPQKRKKNIRRFLVNWLSRAQERGGDIPAKFTTAPRIKSPISTGLAAIAATRQRRPDD